MAVETSTAVLLTAEDADVPLRGEWRNSLCGCCNNCCPSGLAFCSLMSTNLAMLTCIPCLVGQIAARTSWRPNFCGIHVDTNARGNTCTQAWLRIFLITAIPSAVSVLVYCFGHEFHSYTFGMGLHTAGLIVCIVFAIVGLVFLTNMRYYIRQRYDIPADCCCDCCVMFSCLPCAIAQICLPCAIAQMYTHVYATNTGCNICSDPGPHPNAPSGIQLTGEAVYEKTELMRMDTSNVVMAVAVSPQQVSTLPVIAVVSVPDAAKNEQ